MNFGSVQVAIPVTIVLAGQRRAEIPFYRLKQQLTAQEIRCQMTTYWHNSLHSACSISHPNEVLRRIKKGFRGKPMHSPKRMLFLDLVLSLFRLNGLLIAEGDEMTEALGLTSARWKVIGVIALSNSGLTVPGIARVLGQSRQAVQRITDVMATDGLLSYEPNPKHKRSVLVELTEEGKTAYKDLRDVQDPWAIDNTEDIPIEELDGGLRLVRRLIQKFDK